MGNILYKGNTVFYKRFPVYRFGGVQQVVAPPIDPPVYTGGNRNYFVEPTVIAPNNTVTFVPTSAADISNPSNANKIAIISNNFLATNTTFAAGLTIRPNGGVISGTSINLNGAYIEENYLQAFADTVTFTSIYDKSYVTLELFGAVSNNASDDSEAFHAAMKNVQYVRAKQGSTYIKNSTTFINRVGFFTFDGNDCKVEVTDNTNLNNKAGGFLIWTMNLSIKFINAEFDGNRLFGKTFLSNGAEAFHFENLWVHDWYNYVGQSQRALAFRIDVNNDGTGGFYEGQPFGTTYPVLNKFVNGWASNNLIHDIEAEGDCIFNNGVGISKGFWILEHTIDPLFYSHIQFQDNVIYDILGDDAEAVYLSEETWITGNKVYTNNFTVNFIRENYYDCSRRAMKIIASNVLVQDCTFQMITADKATGTLATLVEVFTLITNSNHYEDWTENVTFKNCDFIQPEILPDYDLVSGCNGGTGFIPDVGLLTFQNARDFIVEDCTFNRPVVDNYNAIHLGNSGTVGKVGTGLFKNNVYTNCGYAVLNNYDGRNTVTFEGDILNFTNFAKGNGGGSLGVIRMLSTTDAFEDFLFKDIVVNIDWTSTAPITGWFTSKGGGMTNGEFNNCTLNYLNGSAGGQPNFGDIQNGPLGNTVSFVDCTMNGSSGTGSITATNAIKNPVIINSKGVVNGIETSITVA